MALASRKAASNENEYPARWPIVASAALIAAAALAAYAGSFAGPFFFDDAPSISENATIRHLWPIGPVLHPPSNGALTVAGRPMVNLSLAVNYALGGMSVAGYHALNLAIHILAGLTLFGIVRRSLLDGPAQPAGHQPADAAASSPEDRALPPAAIALAVALLWTLHPLQTESVTYVVQRAESLMGLFYLLTLYCFIRGVKGEKGWYAGSIASCLLGMASKEVMVSAPVVVFLYDRTFVSGNFREALRRRKGVYLGLAGTWLVLGYLMASTGERGGSAGFGLGVSGWRYALTQCRAIALYLKLSVWPHPLVLDYGVAVATTLADVWPQALLLAGLLAGTAWSLVYRPAFGFVAAWFFIILAPTSSVVPVVTQTIAEHRMYLPLASIATLAVLGIHRLAGRRSLIVLIALAAGLGAITARRNGDYRSEAAIWTDAVAKLPGNPRAHYNLGVALGQSHETAEAMAQYDEALRLKPDFAEAHNNLAIALAKLPGRAPEAIAHYEEALRLKPDNAEAHGNLANELAKLPGRMPEALAHFEAALRLKPDNAEVHNDLAVALANLPGRAPEAIAHYEEALRLRPDYTDAHYNLADELAKLPGRAPEAIAHYEEALRLKPDYAEAHYNFANELAKLPGRAPEAIAHYEEALRLRPDYAEAHNNLGVVLAQTPGRGSDAMAHYEEALRLKPDYAEAHDNLGVVLAKLPGREPEAIAHFEAALRLEPGNADAHYDMANALAGIPGRESEAIAHYEEALRLKPDFAEAHNNLAVLYAKSGRMSEAIRHLEMALKLNPFYRDALNNLETFREQLGK